MSQYQKRPNAGANCASLDPDRGDGVIMLADGRQLAYRTFGDPAGAPLIALHGTPGSRLKFSATDAASRSLSIRVIALDRWGYGCTSPHPAPSLAHFADDIAALANQLGLDTFSLLGVSGGGPYAAAIAALLPERVGALALAAPVGPISGEVDAEISWFHRFCFGPLAHNPRAVGLVFRSFRTALGITPELGMRLAMVRVAPADRQVLRQPETRRRLGDTFIEGLRPGVAGPVTDLGLFGKPWGIDLARARVPARIWLGSKDLNIPPTAARRLAQRLGACELVELDGQGHLWIANNYATLLAWVRGVLDA